MQNREHPGSITLDYADPRGNENGSDDVSAMTAERRLATARPRARGNRDERHETLACGLGWFSIGLGVTELLAPPRYCSRDRSAG